MCFHLSLWRDVRYLEQRFGARFDGGTGFEPSYYAAAFSMPAHPVITDREPDRIQLLEWGLIPHWAKSEEQATDIRKGTFNARSDTVFEKASFRSPIKDKRCLVLADGFYEWMHVDERKYPYYIRLKDHEAFAIAGIWDEWSMGGVSKITFSIITTDANPMMAQIHNTKKRMPVILRREDEKRWLEKALTPEQIKEMLQPYDENGMEAHTVSRLISTRGEKKNRPETIAPFRYKQLELEQRKLD
jgi:putative SOS response-associated peptidase YedK